MASGEQQEKTEKDLPEFDTNLSPWHIQNQRAAYACGLIFDPVARVYRDEAGSPVRAEFG